MKRLLAMTVATVIATSGCGYLNAWRNGYGCSDSYGGASCDDGACYGDGAGYGEEYPAHMPSDGMAGPEIILPGETIPAPPGDPLPGP
jgi:hypothetical protein